jgi:hypothetical protein
LDVSKQDEILPVYNNVITSKVLKSDSSSTVKRCIYLKPKKQVFDETLVFAAPKEVSQEKPAPPPKPTKNTPPPPVAQQNTSGKHSGSGKLQPPPKPDSQQQQQPPQAEPNLWEDAAPHSSHSAAPPLDIFADDDDHHHHPAATRKAIPTNSNRNSGGGGGDDFLFFSAAPGKKTGSVSAKESMSNIDGIDDDVPTSSSSPGVPLDRAQLAQRREEGISEKVKKALDVKKEVIFRQIL